jgi:hypothetical protein
MNNRLLIIIGLLLVKCSTTDIKDSQIRADFKNEFPTYNFESYTTLRKVSDSLRVEVKFSKPTDIKTWIDTWIYVSKDDNFSLVKTGKKRIIDPLEPIDMASETNAMLQIQPRHIKIDSIIYSMDTFPTQLPEELVLKALYKGQPLVEPTYIPEGDSIILIYQRHFGNLTAKNHKPK